MERIKGKKDDLTQKIRPGTTWVAGFTQPGNNDDLRAIDSDGAEMRFIPSSRYYASCTIKRGQALSIAQLDDLTEEQKQNKFPYVKITDPDIDESCIGIAMNYAEEGQIVQIQNTGKFNYYTTNSVLYTDTNKAKEIFLDPTGWDFDSVRGQKLYIKKLYNNTTNAEESNDTLRESSTLEGIKQDENGDAYDTDHAESESNSADPTNWFTYDFIDNVYNVKNTIQIGYLTDAPTTTKHLYLKDSSGWKQSIGDTTVSINKDVVIVKNVNGVVKTAEDITLSSTGITIKAGSTPPKAHEAIWVQEYKTNGVIQGYIPVDDLIVTIELDITGDTRGPLDNTQFLVTLGEDIYCSTKKQTKTLTLPNYNEGIYDEIKVLAIAEGEARAPYFRVFNRVKYSGDSDSSITRGFISLRKLDGDTYIIPVLCEPSSIVTNIGTISEYPVDVSSTLMPSDIANFTDVTDQGYLNLSRDYSLDGVEHIYVDENGKEYTQTPKIVIGKPIESLTRDNLKTSISEALNYIFVNDNENTTTNKKQHEKGCTIITSDIGDEGFSVTTKEVGGYYDIYFSNDLYGLLSCTQIDHGRAAPAGTAVLADIRDKDRLNVIGVLMSNNSGKHPKGEVVRVIRMGRIVTLGNLQPGTQYYLGLNGRITANNMYWYDHNVPIGISDSENYFVVDVTQFPLYSYSGNFPLGYIKPSVYGRAEKGFALADGVTLYSKEQYPELYNLLLNWFSEDELKPSTITEADYNRYKAKDLAEMFNEAFSKITLYSSEADGLNDRIGKIESTFDTIQTYIDDLKAKNEEQDEALAELKEVNEKQNTALTDAINSLTEYSDTEDQELKTALTQTIDALKEAQSITDANQDKAFQEQKDAVETAISTLESTLKTYSDSADDSLKTEITNTINTLKETQEVRDEAQDKLITEAEESEIIENLKQELTTSISTNQSNIDTLTENLSTTNETINTLTTNVNSKIDTLEENTNTSLNSVKTSVSNLDTKIDSNNTELVNTINNNKTQLESSIEDVQTSLESKQAELETSLNETSNKLQLLSDGIGGSFSELSNTIDSQNTTIQNLQQENESLKEQISTNEETIQTLQSLLENLTQRVIDLESGSTKDQSSN